MSNLLPTSLLQLVERLNEQQLHALYHFVVERLKLFSKTKALYAMQQFQILDRVTFVHGGEQKRGTVTRLNQKTVTVKLDDGTTWNVSPHLLTKILIEK